MWMIIAIVLSIAAAGWFTMFYMGSVRFSDAVDSFCRSAVDCVANLCGRVLGWIFEGLDSYYNPEQ